MEVVKEEAMSLAFLIAQRGGLTAVATTHSGTPLEGFLITLANFKKQEVNRG